MTVQTAPADLVTVDYCCSSCRKIVKITAPKSQFAAYAGPDRPLIQDAFPDLTVDEREIMISGICGECFDNMFSDG